MFSFVKIFFILMIFLFFTSCHEKDYDIFKDFIMKVRQTENSKKLDTPEPKKSDKVNLEKQNKKAGNLENKDKHVDILETKKQKKKLSSSFSPLNVKT